MKYTEQTYTVVMTGGLVDAAEQTAQRRHVHSAEMDRFDDDVLDGSPCLDAGAMRVL